MRKFETIKFFIKFSKKCPKMAKMAENGKNGQKMTEF